MARLARDVLSIPASGAGVERLFNSARDICHYGQGSLQPQTVSDLMMYMCTSRIKIHEEEFQQFLLVRESHGLESFRTLHSPIWESREQTLDLAEGSL